MPTIVWKSLHLFLYPYSLMRRFFSEYIIPFLGSCKNKEEETANLPTEIALFIKKKYSDIHQTKQPFLYRMVMQIIPRPHGADSSHIAEFMRFTVKYWIDQFKKNGFIVIQKNALFFHSPYRIFPYKWFRVRNFFSKIGLSSVIYYCVKIK
jgi:hypothetical protein